MIQSNIIEEEEQPFSRFDYIYMFVMIIYMGQATPETQRMVHGFEPTSIGFWIPILLNLILWYRNPVSIFNKKLGIVVGIYLLWAILSAFKYHAFNTGEFSYHYFMIFGIFVAYLMDKIYENRLVTLYEKVFVVFCKIDLILWLISIFIPSTGGFFSLFPKTYVGTNVLYVYEWADRSMNHYRNSGVAWEPGVFAVMCVLGLYCNLCKNGIKLKNNPSLWWILATLASTMSTTGYVCTFILFSLFALKKINAKNILIFIFLIIPSAVAMYQLDFIGEKISKNYDRSQDLSKVKVMIEWNKDNQEKGKYLGSIDRFEAAVFVWQDFIHDPLLGSTANREHSYFYKNISTNFALAHGTLKVFSFYGIFMGLFFYVCLWISSKKMAEQSNYKNSMALFIIIVMGSISYKLFGFPIIMSFWFYGLFSPKEEATEHLLPYENICHY